jgi:two-component system, LytTR family, sensor kinase
MSELLNLVGLSTGVVLYAVLFAMVLRAGRMPGKTQFDPLIVAAAALGLAWNLCALPVYMLPIVGIAGPFPGVAAAGFGALGFLPAVVVHSVLRGESGRLRQTRRLIAAVAYAISGVAALLHVASWLSGQAVPSPVGMRLLTYTYVALVLPLAAITRGQPGARRALWVAALAAFTVSALHLTELHRHDASWPIELVGHHASLPLALAILYQDYPFAFADLFLKRALALLAVVALVFAAIVMFGNYSSSFADFLRISPRQVGLLVTLWVGTSLLYPMVRMGTAWFVDTIVLRRPDYTTLRADITRRIQTQQDISTLFSEVCRLLEPALSAREVSWQEAQPSDIDEARGPVIVSGDRATVLVQTSERPSFRIDVTDLTRGRRFLSDDVATLETIAIAVARRVDAIRITRERFEREMREQEIGKLATEAELRALRAQINPHFLFNALTTIGYLIQTAPPRALETLMRLTTLLRAVFTSEGQYTTLGREIDVVEAYLDIERARFEDRLRVKIDVPLRLRGIRVPPLLLQPLVENAVKHGVAPRDVGGDVTVSARLDATSTQLHLTVEDTGAGATADALRRGVERGVGVRNIERRLEHQYGGAASMLIRSTPGKGTVVEIQLPIAAATSPGEPSDVMRSSREPHNTMRSASERREVIG